MNYEQLTSTYIWHVGHGLLDQEVVLGGEVWGATIYMCLQGQSLGDEL